MSDASRKDIGTKIMETITPQMMKSDSQKTSEHATDKADKLARYRNSEAVFRSITN